MVDGLEVPEVLAGLRIDRNDRVRKRVVTRSIAAVVVRRRSGDRQIDDAALHIHRREEAPHVRARSILPAVTPRVVVLVARPRNGPELPQLLAGDDVERARIARRPLRDLTSGRADDGDVAINGWRSPVRNTNRDCAFLAEGVHERAARGVNRNQAVAAHEENARGASAVAWPPADAAASVGGAAGAGAAACSVCAQISLPVSPSSATTRVPLETYITPLTTSGTDVAPPPRRVVHASFSDDTLLVLICFSGE